MVSEIENVIVFLEPGSAKIRPGRHCFQYEGVFDDHVLQHSYFGCKFDSEKK